MAVLYGQSEGLSNWMINTGLIIDRASIRVSRNVKNSRFIDISRLAKMFELCRQYRLFIRFLKFVSRLHPVAAQVLFIAFSLTSFTQANATDQAAKLRQLASADSNPKAMTPVDFQTIAKGFRSGVRVPLQIIARTQLEWGTLWRQHASIEVPAPPLPVIDFDKHIIVGLFLGDKPTGGYDVEIIRAEQSNNDLVIHHREKSPTGGGVVIQSLTQPFHIVRVAGTINSRVIFRRAS